MAVAMVVIIFMVHVLIQISGGHCPQQVQTIVSFNPYNDDNKDGLCTEVRGLAIHGVATDEPANFYDVGHWIPRCRQDDTD